MTILPNVNTDNTDRFEERLTWALDEATPQELVDGVRRACEYIEQIAENADLDMDRVNNATSTCCRTAVRLAKQLRQATKED